MATQLVSLPEVERLSARVIRILGGNPGKFTLQGTNTYLLGTGRRRILIDTGEGKPIWAENLGKVLKSEQAEISTAILTHWHPDHVGGVSDLRKLCPSVSVHKHTPAKDDNQQPIDDEQEFSVEGATLKALFCPGHTKDHMAMLLSEEQDAMFTGDNVLGQGTAVFEDLATYMKSLKKMLDANPSKAYPAHGPECEDAKATIKEYIEHRKQREQQVLDVLKKAAKPMTAMEIVKIIYVDVPENLHHAAERGVLQVLEKLKGEGKVEAVGNNEWKWVDSAQSSL